MSHIFGALKSFCLRPGVEGLQGSSYHLKLEPVKIFFHFGS
jgi:hypothetical protein